MTPRRRPRRSRRPPQRDMDASPFAAILDELRLRIPGAFACALVDVEGETVDYAGLGDPFDVKVTAAHLRVLLRQIELYGKLGDPRWIVLRGSRRSVVARRLPDGYAVVLLLRRRAGFAPSERAYDVCARALAAEAGWPNEQLGPAWHPVDVAVDRRGRPRRVGQQTRSVEVLGSVIGLAHGERGFRVRLGTGAELTLVREAGGAWYADQLPEDE